LRRLKEQVLDQLPPKFVRDAHLDLTAAQRETYEAAEQDGVLRLNDLGDSITIQNVFELILRLKQICNFDPATRESAKLDQLRTDLEEIASSGRKAIIFSQWVDTLHRLAGELRDYGPLEFHGGLSSNDRTRVIEEFRTNPDCHALLLSYGAGAVGLNLQFAQYVFLFDRWWNPAVEDQAINRVHRIGQTEPVFVTRFVATQTIEERIIEVLDRKRALAAEIVPGTEPPEDMDLSEEDIFSLFDIRVRPRRATAA
jgi:SNF2 family DNA or RNA helicase